MCCRAQAISDVHHLHRPCWLYSRSGVHQSMPPLPFGSHSGTLQVLWTTKAITKDIFMVLMERAPAGMDMEAVRAALAQVRVGSLETAGVGLFGLSARGLRATWAAAAGASVAAA